MSNNKEIWMETTHGRKSKCKTEFKAVLNKVLVSTLILTTVIGTTTPAFAANVPNNYSHSTIGYTQEYGISVESAISNIQNTINSINAMKLNGSVSSSTLQTLANQLYSLESAVKASGDSVSAEVKNVIANAEQSIKGLSNASEVEVAIAVVKANLGIDSVVVQNRKAALKSFSDVLPGRWSHDAIMEMVGLGMFAGTKEADANGVGEFTPDGKMTRAQFVTVMTRYLYQDELKAMQEEYGKADPWYEYNEDVALEKGLLKETEFADGLNNPITREEMAMLIVRSALAQGEKSGQLVPTTRIADYSKAGDYYQNYVRQAFSMGLISGYDAKGTFGPKDTLTREQGAMVAYRLINVDTRAKVDFSTPTVEQVNPSAMGAITITEGQPLTQRNAKEGDIFVKADGTKVVLKIGPNGILGEGQGVAPDKNLKVDTGTWTSGRFNFRGTMYDFRDSTGKTLQNSEYRINRTTGEGHWQFEWRVLEKAYPRPTSPGSYDGQVSSDPYSLYIWDSIADGWRQNTRLNK